MKTAVVTNDDLAALMAEDCKNHRVEPNLKPKLVFSSNGQGIALFADDKDFRVAMNSADIIHADGHSVVTASKYFCSEPLPERVPTTDFFHYAAKVAQRDGLTFYMLGSSEAENEKACEKIRELYPKLEIVGRRNGFFNQSEEQEIINEINALKPDVLWVALGKPKQEFWSVKMKNELDVGWIKTCGGLYAFLAGSVSRAPQWMQDWGLEWLFRAMNQPSRYFWRYLITNPKAIIQMIKHSK